MSLMPFLRKADASRSQLVLVARATVFFLYANSGKRDEAHFITDVDHG